MPDGGTAPRRRDECFKPLLLFPYAELAAFHAGVCASRSIAWNENQARSIGGVLRLTTARTLKRAKLVRELVRMVRIA